MAGREQQRRKAMKSISTIPVGREGIEVESRSLINRHFDGKTLITEQQRLKIGQSTTDPRQLNQEHPVKTDFSMESLCLLPLFH